jgi:hypothetical protein
LGRPWVTWAVSIPLKMLSTNLFFKVFFLKQFSVLSHFDRCWYPLSLNFHFGTQNLNNSRLKIFFTAIGFRAIPLLRNYKTCAIFLLKNIWCRNLYVYVAAQKRLYLLLIYYTYVQLLSEITITLCTVYLRRFSSTSE